MTTSPSYTLDNEINDCIDIIYVALNEDPLFCFSANKNPSVCLYNYSSLKLIVEITTIKNLSADMIVYKVRILSNTCDDSTLFEETFSSLPAAVMTIYNLIDESKNFKHYSSVLEKVFVNEEELTAAEKYILPGE